MKYTKRGSGLYAFRRKQAAHDAGQPCGTPRNRRPQDERVYYNPMRKLTFILPFLGASLVVAQQGTSQQPSSLKTTSLESHEGMTITARPWTDPALYKEKFAKKSPYAAGIVAVHVVFRNDSDDSMKINLERIRLNVALSEEDHQALNPLPHRGAKNRARQTLD